MFAFLLVALAAPAAGETAPTAMVMRTQARQGVSPDAAELLTPLLVGEIRQKGRFASVTSSQDVETALDVEKQRQLMECQASTCVAEIAGALGVDYVVSSTVGRLGSAFVFSVTLLEARNARVAANVSETISSSDEASLAASVPGIVSRLLQQGGMTAAPPPADDKKPRDFHITLGKEGAGITGGNDKDGDLHIRIGENQKEEEHAGPRPSTIVGILALPPAVVGVMGILGALAGVVAVATAFALTVQSASNTSDPSSPLRTVGLPMLAVGGVALLVLSPVPTVLGFGLAAVLALSAVAGRVLETVFH